jgi:hypothetical protein
LYLFCGNGDIVEYAMETQSRNLFQNLFEIAEREMNRGDPLALGGRETAELPRHSITRIALEKQKPGRQLLP